MVTQEEAEGDSSSRSDEENARDLNEEKTPISTGDAATCLTSAPEEITGISKKHRTKGQSSKTNLHGLKDFFKQIGMKHHWENV